jgi:DNA-binding transcriptional ArsR family regulator
MGDDRARNSHGRYDDRIDPTTVLDVFDARDDRARPLTASDIVEELDIARRTAHNKLNALVERGVLETRKVGARGRVWWTPIYDTESGRESGETRREAGDDHTDVSRGEATESAHESDGRDE